MPKWKSATLLCLLILGIHFTAASQERTTQFWGGFEADWNFSNFWTWYVNPEYYTLISGGPKWYTTALTTGVNYYVSPHIVPLAGFYTAYTLQTEGESTYEFRPQLGATWNISPPTKRIFAKLIMKYEWRLFRNLQTQTNSKSNRFRFRPELMISILKPNTVEDKNINIRIYGEYFRNMDDNVEERFWNVHSSVLGVYYRHNPKWRYELRYMIQGSRNTKEETEDSTINHILYALVFFVIPASTK